MTENMIFSPDEERVYELQKQMSYEEIKKILLEEGFSDEKVQRLIKELYRKTIMSTKDRMFYAFVGKYRRIFKLAKTHYEEKTKKIKHVFAIDFSDIHVYLDPKHARDDEQDSIGCLFHMFNNKSENHKYCMLPPAIWELLDYMYKTHDKDVNTDFSKFFDIPFVKDFYNCINDVDENNLEVLMHHYKKISASQRNGLRRIVDLALEHKPTGNLKENLKHLQKMIEVERIEPLENFIVDVEKINLDKEIYKNAISNLKRRREERDINNKIDALDFTITCSLTDEYTKFCSPNDEELCCNKIPALNDKELCNKEQIFFRSIYNSRRPVEAFKTIVRDGRYVSCCPQFLSTIILLKGHLVGEKSIIEPSERIKELDEKIKCLTRIREQCFDLSFPQRFIKAPYIEDEASVIQSLMSVHNYLSDLVKFKQIYLSLIKPVMDINLGSPMYHIGSENYSRETIASLRATLERRTFWLFENQPYETVVDTAFNAIYGDVDITYRTLYQHAKEKNILQRIPDDLKLEMDDLMLKIK